MNYNRNSFGKTSIGKLEVSYYSISPDATTIVIVFDGIRMRFDAGTHIHMDGIDVVCVSHTHRDHIRDIHISILPSQDGKIRKVYVPKGTEDLIRKYCELFLKLDGFRVGEKKEEDEGEGEIEEGVKKGIIEGIMEKVEFIEVEPGMEFAMTIRKKKYSMKVFKCFHGVMCVGYGFYEFKKKLKDEFKGLTGRRIGELRKSGVDVVKEHKIPLFLFCGDTSIEFFEKNESEGIFEFPVIFIECTRFDSDMSEEAKANYLHIHWSQLEKYVESNPEITFGLHHFSSRYFHGWEKEEYERERKRNVVFDFFRKYKNVRVLI